MKSIRRKAFTLVEVMVVSGLMAFLAVLISSAWGSLGRPTVALIRRSQCMQEIDMAVAVLARDLGGSLPGSVGDKKLARFSSWSPNGDTLDIYFNGVEHIAYSLENKKLIRKTNDGKTFTAARNVESFQVVDHSSYIQIELSFKFLLGRQYLTRNCTLKVKSPPLSTD
jgi:prepilin-type N-terminal cleavage/methylation domain-containing protein